MNVEKAEVEHYGVYLKDKSRPPSRGGNKRAWHQHVITIDGEKYSFLAPWSGKFVYSGETVSLAWEWDETGKYRNVDAGSVRRRPRRRRPAGRAGRAGQQTLAHSRHAIARTAQGVA